MRPLLHIYQRYCNSVIKRHPAEPDYLAEQATIEDTLAYRHIVPEVEQYTVSAKPGQDAMYRDQTPALVKTLTNANELRHVATNPSYNEVIVHRAYYLAREQRHPVALCCCAAAIGLGLACLG